MASFYGSRFQIGEVRLLHFSSASPEQHWEISRDGASEHQENAENSYKNPEDFRKDQLVKIQKSAEKMNAKLSNTEKVVDSLQDNSDKRLVRILEDTDEVINKRSEFLTKEIVQLRRKLRDPKTARLSDIKELEEVRSTYEKMTALQIRLNQLIDNSQVSSEEKLKQITAIRKELGLPDVPSDMKENYDDQEESIHENYENRDRELEVDYKAINEGLAEADAFLGKVEFALEAIDMAAATAASFVPYGSEVYAFSQVGTKVLTGTLKPEAASKELAISLISGRVGGKLLQKATKLKAVQQWVAKNASKFTPEKIKKAIDISNMIVQKGVTAAAETAMEKKTGPEAVNSFVVSLLGDATVSKILGDNRGEFLKKYVEKYAAQFKMKPEAAWEVAQNALGGQLGQKISKPIVATEEKDERKS